MTEEEKAAELATRKEELEKSNEALKAKSTDELLDIIHSTRSEAKGYRLELKEIKSNIDSLKEEKEKQEQDKKLAEGKKDEVIIELTNKIEGLTKKANEWDDYNKRKRDAIKEKIGENWLESFSIMPLNDLETLATKFNGAKNSIDTDRGGGKKSTSATLEILRKDLALAIEKNNLPDQLAIKRLIKIEEGKK